MKISRVSEESIMFDNGAIIYFDHMQDCCENNYADFEQIEDLARLTNFDEDIIFEKVDGFGFRFGNKEGRMFFIPCYSSQNGYYTSELDIFYTGKGEKVLTVNCPIID